MCNEWLFAILCLFICLTSIEVSPLISLKGPRGCVQHKRCGSEHVVASESINYSGDIDPR